MALTSSTSDRFWNETFTRLKSFFFQETADAIAQTVEAGKGAFRLVGIRVTSDGNVTTSENFTLSIDANAGAGWDHTVLSEDLSVKLPTGGTWEYLFDPKREYSAGDEVDLAFTNTEGNQINIELILEIRY